MAVLEEALYAHWAGARSTNCLIVAFHSRIRPCRCCRPRRRQTDGDRADDRPLRAGAARSSRSPARPTRRSGTSGTPVARSDWGLSPRAGCGAPQRDATSWVLVSVVPAPCRCDAKQRARDRAARARQHSTSRAESLFADFPPIGPHAGGRGRLLRSGMTGRGVEQIQAGFLVGCDSWSPGTSVSPRTSSTYST